MAYRFLLEVPETRIDEGNVVVGAVPDAQVVVVRNPHGQGFADPAADLLIASHTLGVIGAIYDWYDELPKPKDDLAIVLHSGDRVSVASTNRAEMVRRIRRDQPWVERTLPKIGDHMRDVLPGDTGSNMETLSDVTPGFDLPLDDPLVLPSRFLPLHGGAQVAVKVTDLGQAESYYVDFLGMAVLGREHRDAQGNQRLADADYDHAKAMATGTEADVSFLANGRVTLALDRVGRGARLERSSAAPVSIPVDRPTFLEIKGEALMRGREIDGDGVTTVAIRDIYGVVWEFTTNAAVTQPIGAASA